MEVIHSYEAPTSIHQSAKFHKTRLFINISLKTPRKAIIIAAFFQVRTFALYLSTVKMFSQYDIRWKKIIEL